ncbi:MAG: ABC transporter substrate-binding protein [Chloroherpetonaceae bacterium]|nr:ABC transporter substrate-binding protein [Chloroherpetonaceae bacterium]
MKQGKRALMIIQLFFFVSGCMNQNEPQLRSEYSAGSNGKVYGGSYSYSVSIPIESLDPINISDASSITLAHQIFELLVDLDSKTLQLTPELAKSWTIEDGGTTYTFTLRDSVYFHQDNCFPQGVVRAVSAEDVKFSFERVCNPRYSPVGFYVFKDIVYGATEFYEEQKAALEQGREPRINEVKGFEVVDRLRFRIRLNKPFGPFLMTLTNGFCYIVPKEAVLFYGENFGRHPVGTGPFMIKEMGVKENGITKSILIKRNDGYWGKDEFGNSLPFLNEIRVSYIPDRGMQQAEFKKGNLLESSGLPGDIRSLWLDETGLRLSPEYQRDFRYQWVPALATEFLGLHVMQAPFTDVKVRQAIAFAINRELLERTELKGEGVAANFGFTPPTMPKYRASLIKGFKYDPNQAKKLLAQAGFPNGKNFPELILHIPANSEKTLRIARAIERMITETLSIRVSIRQIEWAELNRSIESGKVAFYKQEWVADYAEPQNFLNLYYGKLLPKNPDERSFPNMQRYNSPQFNSIYEKALSTPNDSLRYKLYQQAEQIAVDDASLVILTYPKEERVLHAEVRDNPLNAMSRNDYKWVWLDRLDSIKKK